MPKFKGALIFALILMLLFLCSCQNEAVSEQGINPLTQDSFVDEHSVDTSPSDITPTDESKTPVESAPAQLDNTERVNIFRSFLNDNYTTLAETFYGGISGVGFIDLDRDTGVEMLIFDAGASAAMGVQFFDIIDSSVECISANMQGIGETYGGSHFTPVIVNANFFDDFLLMSENSSGKTFFQVESGNGALDFSYRELIRFGCDSNGALALESLLYKHEEYDIDTGATLSATFKIGNTEVGESEYNSQKDKIFAGIKETGFEAKGVFVWENAAYENGLDGLLAMFDKAASLSKE